MGSLNLKENKVFGEIKMVVDSNSDIDEQYLSDLAEEGWIFIHIDCNMFSLVIFFGFLPGPF